MYSGFSWLFKRNQYIILQWCCIDSPSVEGCSLIWSQHCLCELGARGQQGHDFTTITPSSCASFPPSPISFSKAWQCWADETELGWWNRVVCKFRMEQGRSLTALCADTTQQDDGSFVGHPWTNSQSYYPLLLQVLPQGALLYETHSNAL